MARKLVHDGDVVTNTEVCVILNIDLWCFYGHAGHKSLTMQTALILCPASQVWKPFE